MFSTYINQELIDIIISGYSEKENSYLIFTPMYRWVYLKFEEQYLILNANDGDIKANKDSEVKCLFDIEENDLFTVFSVLNQEYDNVLKNVDYFYDSSSNLIQIGLQLQNRYIFFDSLTINGFLIHDFRNKKEALCHLGIDNLSD